MLQLAMDFHLHPRDLERLTVGELRTFCAAAQATIRERIAANNKGK